MKYWYAVLSDDEDNDWGTGSFDRSEAEKMLAKHPYGQIAVIDGDYDEDGNPTSDPICVEVIDREEVYGPTYYVADSEYSDSIYGDQLPVCMTIKEINRLAREWNISIYELLDQMHEASQEEIEELGVYND